MTRVGQFIAFEARLLVGPFHSIPFPLFDGAQIDRGGKDIVDRPARRRHGRSLATASISTISSVGFDMVSKKTALVSGTRIT